MTRVRASAVIDAPLETVWSAIEDIETHTDWMADAVAIRFLTEARSGVGAAFECDTRIGPVRTTDRLEVTEWAPPRIMGIRHVGTVTGVGRFTLYDLPGGRTRFEWDEELTIPWWMAPPVTGLVLRWVWRRNLRRLAAGVSRK